MQGFFLMTPIITFHEGPAGAFIEGNLKDPGHPVNAVFLSPPWVPSPLVEAPKLETQQRQS